MRRERAAWIRRAAAVGLGGAAVSLLFSGRAGAHADLDPLHDHRVLSVHVTDEGIVLTYVLALSAETSSALRSEADASGDGRLDEPEAARLRARGAALAAGLSLYLDGVKIWEPPPPVTVEDGRADFRAPQTTPRELALRQARTVLPERRGDHTLRVVDETRLPLPGDLHLRLSVEGQGRILGVDHRAEARTSHLEVAFHRGDACQQRACAAVIELSGGGQRAALLPLWIGAGAVLALGAMAWRWLRPGQRPPST